MRGTVTPAQQLREAARLMARGTWQEPLAALLQWHATEWDEWTAIGMTADDIISTAPDTGMTIDVARMFLGQEKPTAETTCCLCDNNGYQANPLRWHKAANGERMLAHSHCWRAQI